MMPPLAKLNKTGDRTAARAVIVVIPKDPAKYK